MDENREIETAFYDATPHLTDEQRVAAIDDFLAPHKAADKGAAFNRFLKGELKEIEELKKKDIDLMIEHGAWPEKIYITAALRYANSIEQLTALNASFD